MRWTAVPALALLLALTATTSADQSGRAADGEAKPCAATRVQGSEVRAGRFTGAIVPEYDVVDGRFRLRVGGMRDVADGLSQKIPWSVLRTTEVGSRLRIDGRRLAPRSPRTFRMDLQRVAGSGRQVRWYFPSIMKPPAEGCWRLRFTSGKVTGSLTVLVRG